MPKHWDLLDLPAILRIPIGMVMITAILIFCAIAFPFMAIWWNSVTYAKHEIFGVDFIADTKEIFHEIYYGF